MHVGWTFLVVAAGGTALAAPRAPVRTAAETLAGRYGEHFRNGDVSGRNYWSDNVVEVVPIDSGHAYFRIRLEFFNGHSCGLYGVAQAGTDALKYEAPAVSPFAGCRITIAHEGDRLRLDDQGGTCSATCGVRGRYSGAGLPFASRHPIFYEPRLRSSRQFREAMNEWRAKGKE